MRKLADYAFMLRDWKLAHSTYDILRKDFANDKAWKYAAGAQVPPPPLSPLDLVDIFVGNDRLDAVVIIIPPTTLKENRIPRPTPRFRNIFLHSAILIPVLFPAHNPNQYRTPYSQGQHIP